MSRLLFANSRFHPMFCLSRRRLHLTNSCCLFDQVEGAVTVQPLAYEVNGFKEYFLNLRPTTNVRNPWFIEYWEQNFQCKFPKSSWTPFNEEFAGNPCTGQEVMSEEEFDMEAQLQFVSDSVLAFAYAFRVGYEFSLNIIMIVPYGLLWSTVLIIS